MECETVCRCYLHHLWMLLLMMMTKVYLSMMAVDTIWTWTRCHLALLILFVAAALSLRSIHDRLHRVVSDLSRRPTAPA